MTRPTHRAVKQRRGVTVPKTMAAMLLLLTLAFSLPPFSVAECPSKCQCFKTTVRCMYMQLERIPDRIPPTTTILDLRFNKIKEIGPSSLTHITQLNTLLLNNNHLSSLQNGVFRSLSKLQFLYLYTNKIENIETRVFQNLTSLEQLYLHFNKIQKLDLEMFQGLTKLDRLFLHNNKIRTIPPGTFDSLTSLTRLRLDSNLLTCDCDILWLVDVLKKSHDSEEAGQFAATCQYPTKMSGKSLMEMTKSDFHCNELRFKEEPNDVSVSFGGSAFFTCKVEGNQNVKVIWTRDNNEIDMSDTRYSMTDDGLMIKSASSKDIGTYECMVKRENVELKSRPAKIILQPDVSGHAPEIVVGPQHKTIQVGEKLMLFCEAIGTPKPSISWAKDDISLESGQRIQVLLNNTLIISRVERMDVGHYKCVASNYLGQVSSEAMVNVNVPPVIISASRDITAKTGATVELKCLVEGYPIPVVTWFKDGRSIVPGPRISFHNERTVLRLNRIKDGDNGMFTCLAQNLVGSAESNTEIKVRGYGPRKPKLLVKPFDMEAPQRTSIEVPCKADGDPTPTITWTKDGVDLIQDQNHKINVVGSLRVFNISFTNSGVYECTAKNIHGQASAKGTIAVLGDVLERSPGDRFVNLAFKEANMEVDRAVNATIDSLFGFDDKKIFNPEKLMRMSRFPDVVARDVAKSADIFERTLSNVRKHVQAGLKINLTENFSYRDLLSVEQLDLIANLSGCLRYQTKPNCSDMCFHTKYRTIDGTCNNLQNPLWGSSHTQFRRILRPIYENGFNTPVGWTKGMKYYGFEKPSARLVSTSIIRTNEITSDDEITHMVMQWGQFLDHDLDHAIPSTTKESWEGLDCKKTCAYSFPCFPMDVPPNDDRVKHRKCIDFIRSSSICGTDTTSVFFDKLQPREQINQLTAFIDGSQIYGFTNDRSFILREVQTGFGLMRGGILSQQGNKEMLPIAGADEVDCRRDLTESDTGCYLAGDIRANEQVGLLAMHTVWIREHNRIARELRKINPHWEGDILFHEARKIVGAELQHITFKHWLPYVIGPDGMEHLGQYQGYDPIVNPSISNVFATAALRFGHSIINPVLTRLDENFTTIPQGDLSLGKAFFTPWRLSDEGGTDPLMRGFFAVPAKRKTPKQNLNNQLIDHLFTSAHAVSLDLAAMNIQRGRDHGIPGYTEWRALCNMSKVETFDDLKKDISDNDVRNKLKELYGHPGNIDVWVGGILEDQLPGSKVGPLFQCLLVEQFKNLRNGDRFWYENPSTFSPAKLTQIKQASLARVLCDNGDNISLISKDVFKLPELQTPKLLSCKSIPNIDLRLWFECNGDCPGENVSKDIEELKTKNELAKAMNITEDKLQGLKSVVEELKLDIKRLKRDIRHLTRANKDNGCYDKAVNRWRREGRTWVAKKCIKCECRNSQISCKSSC